MQVGAEVTIDPRSVVSHISRLRASRGQADPFPIYAELRGLGEVVPAPWGGFLLMSYEACDQVLRGKSWSALDSGWRARQGDGNRWLAPAAQELSHTIQGLNPPEHSRQRRSVGNVFGRTTLEGLSDPIASMTEKCLDQLAERMRDGDADFGDIVAEELPVATIGHWLDLPQEDYPLLRALTHDQAYAQELLPSAKQLAIANEAALGLREYFTELIRQRRKRPGDDVLSDWIRRWDALEPDHELADETVYYLVMFIVIAALETTPTLLSSMVWWLDQHPGQRERLLDHPERVPGAVDEVLRYDPPIHVTSRVATEDTTLRGVRISRDQLVHVMISAANRDPDRTQDPEAFDIGRTGGSKLAFGGGIHYCIGAGLAHLEATILLEALVRRFPRMRVTSLPAWEPRVAFRRLSGLRVAER